MNRWNIPKEMEKEIIIRDKKCVYCGIKMLDKVYRGESRKNAATWEHIINDETIVTKENIARCCAACNSSKGTKKLSDWINSEYCRNKNININTVAPIIKKALKMGL
ncbi:MAG: HNH endonuclease [Spirochaetia bacterium]|nr:HNH endonuclease [Spirochaetia bacterium]